jgi:hypothetical protein
MKAVAQLGDVLCAKGVRLEVARSAEAIEGAAVCIVLAGSGSFIGKRRKGVRICAARVG